MSAYLQELCVARPRQFESRPIAEDCPNGWRDLIFDLVADLAGILGDAPDHRIAFDHAQARGGGLRIGHTLEPPAARDHPLSIVVATLVAAAERRSLGVCDACGDVAVLRRRADGGHVVRCPHHAGGAVPVPDALDSPLALPPPSALGRSRSALDGIVGQACRAFPDALLDLTRRDEVPIGWRGTCQGLLSDVAALMAGSPGTRFEVRRVYPIGRELHWQFAFAGRIPRIVAMGIRVAFIRAAEEARLRCPRCGLGAGGTSADGCDCASPVPPSPHPQDAALVPRSAPSTLEAGLDKRRDEGAASQDPDMPSGPGEAFRIALYKRADVAAAIGCAASGPEGSDLLVEAGSEQTEHQSRIQRIMDRGEDGRWRTLARPTPSSIRAVAGLARSAPHLREVVEHVVRHMRAARAIGMPLSLPPTLLLGPPGVGKTWLLSRIAEALGVPHRVHPLNLSSLGDGIGGSHPVWRNSAPGLVARTLLAEECASPIILVDEFDKGHAHGGGDPYRPFYTLLEPIGARSFIDEYLGFPMDASHVMWVASANELEPIPPPIRSRLTTFEVPMPTPEYLGAVVDSVYSEANAARRGFFRQRLDPAVRAALCEHPPRAIRMMVAEAMVRAAALGRRSLRVQDLVTRTSTDRRPFGFIHR